MQENVGNLYKNGHLAFSGPFLTYKKAFSDADLQTNKTTEHGTLYAYKKTKTTKQQTTKGANHDKTTASPDRVPGL